MNYNLKNFPKFNDIPEECKYHRWKKGFEKELREMAKDYKDFFGEECKFILKEILGDERSNR